MGEINIKKENYNSFDLVKFICSLLVVIIHISPFGIQSDDGVLSNVYFYMKNALCRIAVPMFFILSGFFLYRKTTIDEYSFKPAKRYVLRILKIYLIWSAIYFPLSLIQILRNSNGFFYGVLLFLRKLLIEGSYEHLWYMIALVVSVLLTSFLLCKKWSPKKILCISAVLYMICLFGGGYHKLILPLFDMKGIGTILDLYFKIFTTTRNGLFYGFFFVSVGMYLAYNDCRISKSKSLILFLVSVVLLIAEVFVLRKLNLARAYHTLIFSVPATVYLLQFFKNLKLKDRKIYKQLRTLSGLVYYGHMWILFVVSNVVERFAVGFTDTPVTFILTLGLTIVISISIMNLSERKRFKWLKNLY